MHSHGYRGVHYGWKGFSQGRRKGGRLLEQKWRKINKRHKRRDHLDQHKHGDRDSSSHSDRVVLHLEGKVRKESCLPRAVMTLQGGVREARSHGLPHGTRSSTPILVLSPVFSGWERIFLQLPPLLLYQGQFQITT